MPKILIALFVLLLYSKIAIAQKNESHKGIGFLADTDAIKQEQIIIVENLNFEINNAPKSTLTNNDFHNLKPEITKPESITSAIKLDIANIFRGFTQITYERTTKPNRSFEISLGIIGIGRNQNFGYSDTVIKSVESKKNQVGVFIAAGYKFNKLPILIIGKSNNSVSSLQGAYIRPTVYLGKYKENRIARIAPREYALERPTTTFLALQLEVGKEWIVAKKSVLDVYWGIGYGLDNKKYYSTSYYDFNTTTAYNYCNNRLGRSPGISFSFGIKCGLLLPSSPNVQSH